MSNLLSLLFAFNYLLVSLVRLLFIFFENISTYYNLSDLSVKKGDKVASKDVLGTIYTNRSNGQTRLKFYLYQDTSRLNPEEWVYRL